MSEAAAQHAGLGRCPVCGGATIEPVARFESVVVHCNLLWPTREAALRAPRADLELVACADCGHAYDAVFDPALTRYGEAYENALDFSETFRGYASELADRLIERHDLHGKTIVEIGCGSGDFLASLCERGGNAGVGFDPGVAEGGRRLDAGSGVVLVRGELAAAALPERVDFVCSRHVLEHVESPVGFLASVREVLDRSRPLGFYFEVPNGSWIFREPSGWDVIYEHFSYFGAPSLTRLLAAAGFGSGEVAEGFHGQFLGIEGSLASDLEPSRGRATEAVAARGGGALPARVDAAGELEQARAFGVGWPASVERMRERLARAAGDGRHIVVWGMGSKGTMLLNELGAAGRIEHAIDVNPRKHGMFVAGAGQEIGGPSSLREHGADLVVVMNAAYRDEIVRTIADLGVGAEVVTAAELARDARA